MPLDGHSYLVSQGWSGKGTGLRQGAIAKPIAITQKKTLAGLGKDRDEAFPFWDHLFSAASKTIQVKISNNDSDVSDSDTPAENSAPTLKRTTTGILCNRRPVDVTPATTSGTSTPDVVLPDAPKLSLIALAKREAAKRNLYSRFYRGPIIGPDDEPPKEQSPHTTQQSNARVSVSDTPATEDTPKKKKKRKAEEMEKEERRERKRMKKEAKEAKERERERKKQKKSKKAEKAAKKLSAEEEVADGTTDNESERRRRKREAKLKRQANGVEEEAETPSKKSSRISATGDDRKSSKKRKKKTEAIELETSEVPTIPKAKKKRKDD